MVDAPGIKLPLSLYFISIHAPIKQLFYDCDAIMQIPFVSDGVLKFFDCPFY